MKRTPQMSSIPQLPPVTNPTYLRNAMRNDMITYQMLATELEMDLDVITDLAWDIVCQSRDLTSDFFRFPQPIFATYSLADVQLSDALVARIKGSLDAVVLADEAETAYCDFCGDPIQTLDVASDVCNSCAYEEDQA